MQAVPAPSGAIAVVLLGFLTANSALARVTETSTRQTYEVRAATGDSLFNALNGATPLHEDSKPYHADTRWSLNWTFQWKTTPQGQCQISSVAVDLSVTMTMPQLKSGSPAVTAQFKRYFAALLTHEEGHRAIARKAADQAERAIAQLPPQLSCALLDQEANRTGMAILDEAKWKSIDYDNTTRHGCTQGACLTLP